MSRVLILTERTDDHAKAVSECLLRKGATPIRWFTDEFLHNQKVTQKISHKGMHSIHLDIKDNRFDLINVDVVWYRRVGLPSLADSAADYRDIRFIEKENRMHMHSLWLTLGEAAKWINPYSSFTRSNSKIFQLREAARLGLIIPETLITNDKKSILEFIQGNKGQSTKTIYKTFSPAIWEEEEKSFNLYTTEVTPDLLPDESILTLTPGIYQKNIKKKYEVRITFFGEEYVAVKIHNTESLDWRNISGLSSAQLSVTHLPLDIEKKCISLMAKLGIVFGCFDFIVTEQEEYVFLEVNEMGQFLWIEEILPELNLLDRFCEFLLAAENKSPQLEPILIGKLIGALHREYQSFRTVSLDRIKKVSQQTGDHVLKKQLDVLCARQQECLKFLQGFSDQKKSQKAIRSINSLVSIQKHLILLVDCCMLVCDQLPDDFFWHVQRLSASKKINRFIPLQILFSFKFQCACDECRLRYKGELQVIVGNLNLAVACLPEIHNNSNLQSTNDKATSKNSVLAQMDPFKVLGVSLMDSKETIKCKVMKLMQKSPRKMAAFRLAQSELYNPAQRFVHNYFRYLSYGDFEPEASPSLSHDLSVEKIPFRHELHLT